MPDTTISPLSDARLRIGISTATGTDDGTRPQRTELPQPVVTPQQIPGRSTLPPENGGATAPSRGLTVPSVAPRPTDDPTISSRLRAARFWRKDDVARQIVAELAAENRLATITLADENRLAAALGANWLAPLVMGDTDREALRQLYTHPTEDPAFYDAEAGHIDAIKRALLEAPERAATRARWTELTDDERLRYLRSAASAIATAYGVGSIAVEGFSQEAEDGLVLLGYASGNTVHVNTNAAVTADFDRVLMTVIHEVTHIYQKDLEWRLARRNLGIGSIADEQRRLTAIESLHHNRRAYVDSGDSFTAYQNQPMELHARWAATQVGSAMVRRTVANGEAVALPELVSVPITVNGRTYRGVAVRVP